jgi:hypothetical protein
MVKFLPPNGFVKQIFLTAGVPQQAPKVVRPIGGGYMALNSSSTTTLTQFRPLGGGGGGPVIANALLTLTSVNKSASNTRMIFFIAILPSLLLDPFISHFVHIDRCYDHAAGMDPQQIHQ